MKKTILMLFTFVMVSVLFMFAFSVSAETVIQSGSCGDNLTYTLDSEGVLTVSGTGDMSDWSHSSYATWYSDRGKIKKAVISQGVTGIGNYAFYNCTSLETITIPDSVTCIGAVAFSGTAYYNNSNNWENDVLYIGDHLIVAKDSIPGVYTIKNGTKTIADAAFTYSQSLTGVTIPDSVTNIGDSVFSGCVRLESITIPDSITSIGFYAFSYCTGLESITFYDSVTSIGNGAFSFCTSLADVYYIGTEKQWSNISIGVMNEGLTNATIHFNPAILIGDLNGDDAVNSFDRTILARYIANWQGYSESDFNYEAADVDNNGVVNSLDRTILTRHVANWEGYQTLPYGG